MTAEKNLQFRVKLSCHVGYSYVMNKLDTDNVQGNTEVLGFFCVSGNNHFF